MSRKIVIAIETAGIFEAFPYPMNIEVAKRIENSVREQGVCPALIAVMNGKLKVGLEEEEMELLANPPQPLMKASVRDLPMLLAKKTNALTSVAAAMRIADAVGITVVCGGGIGGVHRGAQMTFDISADLEELTRSGVIMVCSGAKSILDLPLTMEYLETHSVCVAGYRTKELPAYLSIHSGCKLDFRLDTPTQVAECYKIQKELGIPGSLLLTNPINELYAVDSDEMNRAIDKALQQAEEAGVKGKALTKFIMDIVKEELGEDAVEASIQINVNNAVLAAKIAKEI